jgi:hypothetical protein
MVTLPLPEEPGALKSLVLGACLIASVRGA